MRITYTSNCNIEIAEGKFTINEGMEVTLRQYDSDFVNVSPIGLEDYITIKLPTKLFDGCFDDSRLV